MYLELKILSAIFSLNVKWLLLLKVRYTNASYWIYEQYAKQAFLSFRKNDVVSL